jgi:hypothetical protein
MSHDIEASYAAIEVVNYFLAMPGSCFATPPLAGHLSAYAAREGRYEWPHADGVVELAVTSGSTPTEYSIAMEFKRPNEGLHGVLTAIGQSCAYLRKGYSGAVIVIPSAYPGFDDPGSYVRDVLDLTSRSPTIGVFTYSPPDMSKVSPFAERLRLRRALEVDSAPPVAVARPSARTETQWAHVREGSTEPDAFFKYLQAVKMLGGGGVEPFTPELSASLRDAVQRVRAGEDPERYLSNCPNDALADKAWRHFWFKYVLHADALQGWSTDSSGQYLLNTATSFIQRSDSEGKKSFFVGRKDSIKNKMVNGLNSGYITEHDALDQLVSNYFRRAHSYREDIDSGCEHLGFVDGEGRLTDSGYRFVDACERFGNPNEGLPRAIFLNALLVEGSLGAFLNYAYRLSEERFKSDPMAFTSPPPKPGKPPTFQQGDYLRWLEDGMANRLHVMRKVSLRGGTARPPFQAELAVLRNLGIVSPGFRIGVGLNVNWPEFQKALAM